MPVAVLVRLGFELCLGVGVDFFFKGATGHFTMRVVGMGVGWVGIEHFLNCF